MIALDIAEHFKTKIRPNGFKAQVVASSRAAALRYAEHLNAFGVRAYPIITAAPNDGPEFGCSPGTRPGNRSSTPSSIRRGSRRRWSWSTCC